MPYPLYRSRRYQSKYLRKPKVGRPWTRAGGRRLMRVPFMVRKARARKYLEYLLHRKMMRRKNMIYLNRIIRSGRAGAA